ncbi:hypothetical protein TNCV_4617191 [Trichonephila clavipes]|nr:hypothetical protein TNCV_4617191 [Trichonephila clavipes]
MACGAEDCGFQMLNDDKIVTFVQEESDPIDDETDEDEDNNSNESSKGPSNAAPKGLTFFRYRKGRRLSFSAGLSIGGLGVGAQVPGVWKGTDKLDLTESKRPSLDPPEPGGSVDLLRQGPK